MWSGYADRHDAGRRLAGELLARAPLAPALVLGLPRGGVPVAAEVAAALRAPLDVLVVRKVGAPFNPELALGAIASGGIVVRDPRALGPLRIDPATFEATARREQHELERRERAYRAGRPSLVLRDATVVLVDDGLATGSTMLAAVRAARAAGAARVVAAAPVGAADAVERVRLEADEVVVPQVPPDFSSVGEWYLEFPQVGDDEVQRLLAMAPETRRHPPARDDA